MADPKSPYSAVEQNDRALAAGAASLTSANQGKAGAFNVFRYPSDLGSDQHPHYLMFFITVRESDISKGELATLKNDSVQFDFSQNNSGVDKSTESAVGFGVATSAVGALQTLKTVSSTVSSNVLAATSSQAAADTAGAAAGVTAGGVVGGASALTLGLLGQGSDQITLKTAIALYMTGKPSVQYQANWADEDIGIVGGISKTLAGMSASDGIGSLIEGGLKGVGGGMASYVLTQAQKGGDFGGLGNAGAAFSAAAGVTQNPFKAQLFKSMGFRKFSYEYVFLPRNITEYKETQNIIKTFKVYMHPTLGVGKFILNYPAEFTIAYFHKADRNKELYKISNCALTNLSIEYGGTDFTTFKETAGYPTEISMKLEFTELEVLSRERIEAGY